MTQATSPRKETLESIGCRIVRDQKTDIAGYIGPKTLSWGEMISVVFVDTDMKIGRLFPQTMDWESFGTRLQEPRTV